MKPRIRPYLQFLLKQNGVYFGLLGGLLLLAFIIIPFFISQISTTSTKLQDLKTEVDNLENKRKILQAVINENGNEIDQDLALVTGLIPDAEDYFSMIYSLEKLSADTGFSINSYTVNLTRSNENKLSLTVTGVGDSTAFLNLLKTYNYGGGRLITAEKIGIDPLEQNGVSLDLNFYNRQATLDSTEKLDFQASINELSELRAKVNFSLVPASSSAELQGTDYPTKTTPF